MRSRLLSLALLCLAPHILGGTCGSVLRRYDPVGWEYNHSSNAFERRLGDVRVELTGLIRQTGHLGVALTNHGSSVVELLAVELRVGEEKERWTPPGGSVSVAPGARQAVDVTFRRVVHESRCQVVLMLSTGELAIELAV